MTLSQEKRLTLRLSQSLWRQLRVEAARRDVSATLLINQLLEERLGDLSHIELSPTLSRLRALVEREEGWNGYDAPPPDATAIALAETWLADLYRQVKEQGGQWHAPHVTSSPEGEVVFEWWNDPRKLTLYCTATESYYVKVWGPDMVTQMEDGDAAPSETRRDLWRWLMGESADG